MPQIDQVEGQGSLFRPALSVKTPQPAKDNDDAG
jgi:hypothetical protein